MGPSVSWQGQNLDHTHSHLSTHAGTRPYVPAAPVRDRNQPPAGQKIATLVVPIALPTAFRDYSGMRFTHPSICNSDCDGYRRPVGRRLVYDGVLR